MRVALFSVAGLLLALIPVPAQAIVFFGRVNGLHAQTCWPEGLKPALESRQWIDGTTFNGWGLDQTQLYYAGDTNAFESFVNGLRDVRITHVGSDGRACPTNVSLVLAPGRGRLTAHAAKLHGIKTAFDYDWSVLITQMYDDQAGRAAPFVVSVTDTAGQAVQRRIAREETSVPNLTITVFWYVGDGAALDDIALPTEWLFDSVSRHREGHSVYLSRPIGEPVDPMTDRTVLAGRLRIEQYLADRRHRSQQAAAAWRIADFYGITINLDRRENTTPAIVARYGDATARFDVRSGDLISRQGFPSTATDLVKRWLERRRGDVLRQWNSAENNEPIEMLQPLD